MHLRSGLTASLIAHTVFFTIIYFGLPSFMDKKMSQEQVITVELLSVSEITNVKPRKVTPKFKPEPKKKEVIAANEVKKALPDPIKRPEPKVEPEPLPTPVAKKKPEIVKKEKVDIKPLVKLKPKIEDPTPKEKPEPKKEEVPEDAFAAVLKSVEELKAEDPQKPTTEEKVADFSQVEDFLSNIKDETKYKEGLPLTLSEKDAIRQQISRNWTVFSGAKGAKDMVVSLQINMARDGSVTEVKVLDKTRYNTDSFYRATVDSTIRAVYKSSPLQNLPLDKYDVRNGWNSVVLNFDPNTMFY